MLLSEQVRKVILESGVTLHALSRHTGIAESMLLRFIKGTKGMTLSTLDRLAPALGIALKVEAPEVIIQYPPGRPKGGGKRVDGRSSDRHDRADG